MGLWSRILGTLESTFQLGKGGPKWKASSGVLEARNAADGAYAIVRGGTPSGADDLATKGYADGLGGIAKHRAEMTRAAAQSINTASMTKVAFDTVVFDALGGVADATTNDRFNIARTGYYIVNASWALANVVDDGEQLQVSIYLNGVGVRRDYRFASAANQYVVATVSCVLQLTVGDYIEMHIYHTEGGSQNTSTTEIDMPRMTLVEL